MADRSVFECGMCKELYDEERHKPLNLPCGHVFCEECLARLSRLDDLKCPYHKQKLQVSLKDLPRLLTLLKYLPSSRPKDFVCPLHPKKKVKYRCKTHDAYLCSDCIIAHTDHAVENFTATPGSVKTMGEDLRKTVNKRCTMLGEARKNLEMEERKVKSNYEVQVRNVTSVYDDAVTALNQKRKDHLSSLKESLLRQLQQLDQEKARLSRLSDAASTLSTRLSKLSLDINWEETVRGLDDISSETKRLEEWKPIDLPLYLFEDAVKITDSSTIVAKNRSSESKSRGGDSRDMQKTRTPAWETLSGKFWICKECSMPNSPELQVCTRCQPPRGEVVDFSRSLGCGSSPKTATNVETGGFELRTSKYLKSEKEVGDLTRKPSLKSYAKAGLDNGKSLADPGLSTRRPRGRKHTRYCSVRKRNNSF